MPHATEPSPSAGRIVAVVSGAIAGLVAFGLVVAGAVLLYANGQKDHDGYVSTGSDRFHTRTYALATDDLDVNTDAPDWVDTGAALGHVRLKATSRDGKPVFVGIAPTKDVDAYLRGTSHATVTDVDYSPFHASYRTRSGSRPAPPVAQRFWSASANGNGTQTVEWKVRSGNWSVVVMNADGSADIHARVRAGARLPWLDELEIAAWVAAAVLLALGGGLLAAGVRRRPQPSSPGESAWAA
jgi:hypothetical protein